MDYSRTSIPMPRIISGASIGFVRREAEPPLNYFEMQRILASRGFERR